MCLLLVICSNSVVILVNMVTIVSINLATKPLSFPHSLIPSSNHAFIHQLASSPIHKMSVWFLLFGAASFERSNIYCLKRCSSVLAAIQQFQPFCLSVHPRPLPRICQLHFRPGRRHSSVKMHHKPGMTPSRFLKKS